MGKRMKFEEFFIIAQGPILETVALELKNQSSYPSRKGWTSMVRAIGV
jgi:hypothetical protein